jgi:hypothetical protein
VDVENPADALSNAFCTPAPASGSAISALFRWSVKNAPISYPYSAPSAFTLTSTRLTGGESTLGGLAIDDDRTALDVLNEIAAMGCAGWLFDSAFSTTLVQLEEPTLGSLPGTLEFIEAQIFALERLDPTDAEDGVPAWSVTVEYLRMQEVQNRTDVAGGVTAAEAALVGREYRQVADTDVSVRTQWVRAPAIVHTTNLLLEANASSLATRLLDLYSVRRDLFKVTVAWSKALSLIAGQRVHVTHARYGLEGGEYLFVLGVEHDLAANRTTFWGWK